MATAVCPLVLGWRLGGNSAHAQHASKLLRAFFCDPDTRMNPHLTYAQRIPGVCDGRGIGIIDTHCLVPLVELIPLLRTSPAWSEDDDYALRSWFARYLDWLEQSPLGREERDHPNNHGTWYDLQVAAFSLYAGQPERARRVLEQVPERRIVRHIEPDGRQPHELSRTLSLTYSIYNLQALTGLAELAPRVGIDLWNFADSDGRSIRAAVRFLTPYLAHPLDWPYQQIKPVVPQKLAAILRIASCAYGDPDFERALRESDTRGWHGDIFALFYPARVR